MSKIEINGVELELNLLDADVVEEYERLTKKIVARIQNKKAYEGKSNAEAMRYQCRCVDEFFDGLFGPGTSEELFPKKGDLAARMDGFGKAMGAMEDSRNTVKEIVGKYTPDRVQNRQQRRANKKNFRKQVNERFQDLPPFDEDSEE